MPLGTRILLSAAILCFLLLGIALAAGFRPLVPAAGLQVIYAEHEDFLADGSVFRKLRNDRFYVLYLPRARPAYRWWAVDFGGMTIRAINAPRSCRTRKFLLKNEPAGTSIDDRQRMGDWTWHFTDGGASFAGNGFTCSVRKNKTN